ncbi:NDR1/HIN1-like protein 10 [Musa acuminata AAA Group]|uniref:NDR1/HIN1-like protein 10 n=1 Tax=Musa acuminata AAA Group TaxID=214697 RepID=UPI0031E39A19
MINEGVDAIATERRGPFWFPSPYLHPAAWLQYEVSSNSLLHCNWNAYPSHVEAPNIMANSSRGSRDTSGSGGCCCKLLCSLVQLVISLGLVVLIWWLIFHPRLPRASVQEAQLMSFSLADNSTALLFNLTVGLALRNPNKRVGIYYDSLVVAALYHGVLLQTAPLPTFYQHHKNTTAFRPEFGGKATDAGSVAVFYGKEKSERRDFNFEVKLRARIRMKVWFIKIGHFNPVFDCKVRVLVPQDGGMSATFRISECDR